MCQQVALYAENGFVYICWLYVIHWIELHLLSLLFFFFAFRYGSRASPCSTVLATGSEFTHHIGTKSPLHDYGRGLPLDEDCSLHVCLLIPTTLTNKKKNNLKETNLHQFYADSWLTNTAYQPCFVYTLV